MHLDIASTNDERRKDAVARAGAHAPFLRALAEARAELVDTFLGGGSEAAIAAARQSDEPTVDINLRRQRQGLALAIALGDLSGELSLEAVTAALSEFADWAIDQAIRTALLERAPDTEPAGFTAIALGK